MSLRTEALRKGKILILAIALGLFLFFYSPSFAEIKVFFSPNGGIAEEIIKQIDNAQEYIDIAIYSFTYEPIAGAMIRAKNREVEIRILMDKGQSQGNSSKYKFFLNNDIVVIQDSYHRWKSIVHWFL